MLHIYMPSLMIAGGRVVVGGGPGGWGVGWGDWVIYCPTIFFPVGFMRQFQEVAAVVVR